jgi:hypothetical protein
MHNQWKYFKKWLINIEKSGNITNLNESRKAIIMLIEKLIYLAN